MEMEMFEVLANSEHATALEDPDLLPLVLAKLSLIDRLRCEAVCKMWQDTIRHSPEMHTERPVFSMDGYPGADQVSSTKILKALSCVAYQGSLHTIDLWDCPQMTWSMVAPYCGKSLRLLRLGARLTEEDMGDLFTRRMNRELKAKVEVRLQPLQKKDGAFPEFNQFNAFGDPLIDQVLNQLLPQLKLADLKVHLDLGRSLVRGDTRHVVNDLLQCRAIRSLDLSGNKMKRPELRALGQNTSLTHLNLHDNHLGEAGASAVADSLGPNCFQPLNSTLHYLDISGNGIMEGGARKVAAMLVPAADGRCSPVRQLHVGHNSLGVRGALAFANALRPAGASPAHPALEALDLRLNFIGPAGAQYMAAALRPSPAGHANTALKTLNLQGNNIGPDGAKALSEMLTARDGTEDPGEGGEEAAPAQPFQASLTALNLANNSLCGVATAPTTVYGEGGQDRNRALMADASNYTTAGIAALAAALTPRIMQRPEGTSLLYNRKLKYLDLSGNCLGDRGARVVAAALVPQGRLRDGTVVCNRVLEEVTINVAIPVGALRHGTIRDLDLSLAKRRTTESKPQMLRSEDAIVLAACLASNSSVTAVNLAGNKLGDEGLRALCEAVTPAEGAMYNRSLRHLDLSDVDVSEEGARALAAALRPSAHRKHAHSNLTSLGLAGSLFSGFRRAERLGVLMEALTPFRREDGKWVCNCALKSLDLRRNAIEGPLVPCIANALRPNKHGCYNKALQVLNLDENRVGSEGARALAEALRPREKKSGQGWICNHVFRSLHLQGNAIHSEGARAIALALSPNPAGEYNCTLRLLDLRANQIGDEGAQALACALQPRKVPVRTRGAPAAPEPQPAGTSLPGKDESNGQKSQREWDPLRLSKDPVRQSKESVRQSKDGLLRQSRNPVRQSRDLVQQSVESVMSSKGGFTPRPPVVKNHKGETIPAVPEAGPVKERTVIFNPSLKTLDLSGNNVGEIGSMHIAEALKPKDGLHNTNLKTLSLAQNNVGVAGAKAIGEALKPDEQGLVNRLQCLNLAANALCGINSRFNGKFTDEGIRTIAAALEPDENGKVNTALRMLDLIGNRIPDQLCMYLRGLAEERENLRCNVESRDLFNLALSPQGSPQRMIR